MQQIWGINAEEKHQVTHQAQSKTKLKGFNYATKTAGQGVRVRSQFYDPVIHKAGHFTTMATKYLITELYCSSTCNRVANKTKLYQADSLPETERTNQAVLHHILIV